MAQALNMGDIAYALHSIQTTGGCAQDADIIEAALDSVEVGTLDLIRRGMATAEVAAELEKRVWEPTIH